MESLTEDEECIDSRWTFVGDAVAACAFQIGEPNEVRPGTVYRGAISSHHPLASTPHLMSVPPFLWNPFDALSDAFGREQPDLYSIEGQSARLTLTNDNGPGPEVRGRRLA